MEFQKLFRRFYYRTWMGLEQLYLVVPVLAHEAAHNEVMMELQAVGETRLPAVSVEHADDFSSWIAFLDSLRQPATCPDGFVTGDRYFLVNGEGRLIGGIDIRHRLNEFLSRRGGNIGYGVRPSMRRKGYAKVMLNLALGRCRELGLERVLITCDKANFASAKTILACGGVLENEMADGHGVEYQKYWIRL